MSVLHQAFNLVCVPSLRGDVERFMRYIDPLSYDGIPGEKLYMNLRGVSTHVAYIRILIAMEAVQASPGKSRPYCFRGLAEQLVGLQTTRTSPSWGLREPKEHKKFFINQDAWKENLLVALLVAAQSNSGQVIDIQLSNLSTSEIIGFLKRMDSEYFHRSWLNSDVLQISAYFDHMSEAIVNFEFKGMLP